MSLANQEIQEAAVVLREGGVVVFPTETVYGIGAHAFDPDAVARVFEIKGRPHFNPLIVHLPSIAALGDVVAQIPDAARALAKAFWPGPLTLVLPKRPSVPELVTAGLPSVAVRMPSHPIAQALLKAAGVPVAAPSANLFTRLSPTRVEHAREQLGDQVDLYLDGGPCEVGVESTIVGWIQGRPTLLRRGGLAVEDIEAVIGPLAPIPDMKVPLAPGNLDRHYAPRTPLVFGNDTVEFEATRRVGLLTLRAGTEDESRYTTVKHLSLGGSLREAATNLFANLHDLETQDLDLIVARSLPEEGLGAAINDRLRRASHKGSVDF